MQVQVALAPVAPVTERVAEGGGCGDALPGTTTIKCDARLHQRHGGRVGQVVAVVALGPAVVTGQHLVGDVHARQPLHARKVGAEPKVGVVHVGEGQREQRVVRARRVDRGRRDVHVAVVDEEVDDDDGTRAVVRLQQLVALLLERDRQAGLREGVAAIQAGVQGDALRVLRLVLARAPAGVHRARVGHRQVHGAPNDLKHVATLDLGVKGREPVVGHDEVDVRVPGLVVVARVLVDGGQDGFLPHAHVRAALGAAARAQVGAPVKVNKASNLAVGICCQVGPVGVAAEQVPGEHQVKGALLLHVVHGAACRPLDQHQQPRLVVRVLLV
mmetsp:Transcript_23307/g.59594  ORF Transcript_23307/g.59594 Transcript_23307/m.59594 type:complete len:329 (-) Transcript_23307:570-1556(-)